MTREPPAQFDAPPFEAGAQVAHLCELLAKARRIAGSDDDLRGYRSLDEAARISAAYDRSVPLVQRRFDALAEETAAWAEVGLDALLGHENPPHAAAAQLVRELEQALRELRRTLQLP